MTLAPKIAMSDDFLKSFAAVQREQQQAVPMMCCRLPTVFDERRYRT